MHRLRRWGPFSLASHGVLIIARLCAFADLILGVLVLLAVIKHFGVIGIRQNLGSITEQNDPPVLPSEPPAPVVKVKFVLIGTIMIELVADPRTARFGCKGD